MDSALDFVEAWLKGVFFFWAESLLQLPMKVKVKSLSCSRLFATPWIVACTKLLRPWDFQGKSTGVGCHFLLRGAFPTQGSNPGLSHCRQTLYRLSHQQGIVTANHRVWVVSMYGKWAWSIGTVPDHGLTGEGVEADWRGLPYRVDLLGIHRLWHFSSLRGVMPRGSHP